MNCYVFRINYGEHFGLVRKEIVEKHRLRQGWGTYGMRLDQGYESFKEGWQQHWGSDFSDKQMRSRYKKLAIMTEIMPGDFIIVPKVSLEMDYVCRSFIIAKCKEKYQFSVLETVKDFGHFIEVEDAFSCGYDINLYSQTISSKFVAYQSPLNRVYNSDFTKAVDELVKLHDKKPIEFEKESVELIDMIDDSTREERNQYLGSIVVALNHLGTHKFEDIIAELFEKNGYMKTGSNQFDKKGGDVDVIFEAFNENTLMHNIYEICDIEKPHIYVQAKKKNGSDKDDIVGVNQLTQMRKKIPEKNAILIVINLTDSFSYEAKRSAKEYGIILIDGKTFASLLIRYGIEVQ